MVTWRAHRKLPSLLLMVHSVTPYDLLFPQNGGPKCTPRHMSNFEWPYPRTWWSDPLHVLFWVGFLSWSADWMALFPVYQTQDGGFHRRLLHAHSVSMKIYSGIARISLRQHGFLVWLVSASSDSCVMHWHFVLLASFCQPLQPSIDVNVTLHSYLCTLGRQAFISLSSQLRGKIDQHDTLV